MASVYSVEQIRALEQSWAAEHGGSTWALMQSAAQSFVRQYLRALSSGSVLVVVGNGNNGGDGYVIARLLREAGLAIDVYAPLGEPAETLDACRARKDYLAAGGSLLTAEPSKVYSGIVDALFGIGLSRSITGTLAELIEWINAQSAQVYAVDIPSGLCASTGRVLGVAIQADLCHTFIGYKPGLLTHSGPQLCGQLSMDTLDLEAKSPWQKDYGVTGLPERSANTHKAMHGNVRILGGRLHMTGAAIIAGRAALNSGAGRVFIHTDDELIAQALVLSPELMLADSFCSQQHTDAACYVIGPGLGLDGPAEDILRTVLGVEGARGVLDADALTLLARSSMPVSGWVLTPHEAEAARLLGVDTGQIQADRVAAVIALAKKYSTTVVLKGAGTLVAHDSGLIFCHPGSSAMATPGMGDCLAGIVGSLMAQGLDAHLAAVRGVNWHARLGASLAVGRRIVLASDIIQLLPNRVSDS